MTGKVIFYTVISTLLTGLYFYVEVHYNQLHNGVGGLVVDSQSRFPLVINSTNSHSHLLSIDWFNSSSLFNTVNNALRRKGSDLNPIGVSFIPASISEGTLLYHGNRMAKFPSNPEWVAMEPEFSYLFESGLRKSRRGRPMNDTNQTSLLTFISTDRLNLVLLDGASGAKTSFGEMDTQMLLSRMERDRWDHMQYRDELIMAQKICDWGRPYGLDGIVRLEVSFEVIICDFKSDKMELISNVTYPTGNGFLGLPPADGDYAMNETDYPFDTESILKHLVTGSGYDHLKAGEARYNGDSRIQLDFSKMVTAINRTYLPPDTYTRRLNNITEKVQDDMINDIITGLTVRSGASATNWQITTDNIVTRFGPVLSILNDTLNEFGLQPSSLDDIKILGFNLTTATYNIARRHTDILHADSEPLDWFVYEYSHPTHPLQSEMDTLIWSSVHNVVERIGKEIFSVFQLSKDIISVSYQEDPSDSWIDSISARIDSQRKSLIAFLNDLNWSCYYQCPEKCNENEICFVPTWGPSPYRWKTVDENGQRHRVSYTDLKCISIYDF